MKSKLRYFLSVLLIGALKQVIYHQLISVNNGVYEVGGYSTPNGYLEDRIHKLNY